MAQEYAGEKTEPASQRRRDEARRRGQIPRSQDLSSALMLLAGFVVLYYDGDRMLARLQEIQAVSIDAFAGGPWDAGYVLALAADSAWRFFGALGPLFGALAAAGIGVHLLQVGFVFTLQPVTPDLNKLNPVSGLRNLVSLRGVIRLASSVLKLAVIGTVVGLCVAALLDDVSGLAELSVAETVSWTGNEVFWIAMKVVAVLLFLAVLDYGYQRWDHDKELRMTKQEAADEMKLLEGNPEVRKRRTLLARQLARQRMMRAVERADVVITNPTELAVALRYDQGAMRAPRVVAKGARLMAQRIRALALLAGVPIVEKKSLAQLLFRACEVGDAIPPDLYRAVAEVLAYIYRLDPGGARAAGKAA